MLNILSTTEKKKVLLGYRLRLAVIAVFAVGALILSSLILLAPSYLLAVTKYNSQEEQLKILDKKYGGTGQEKELGAQIREINSKILLLSSGDMTTRLSPPQVILNIIKIKGPAIKIHGFTYDVTPVQERIVLTANARDRDALAAFLETLKKDPTYTTVTLPISSYVKSTNIDFSLVVERKLKPAAKK